MLVCVCVWVSSVISLYLKNFTCIHIHYTLSTTHSLPFLSFSILHVSSRENTARKIEKSHGFFFFCSIFPFFMISTNGPSHPHSHSHSYPYSMLHIHSPANMYVYCVYIKNNVNSIDYSYILYSICCAYFFRSILSCVKRIERRTENKIKRGLRTNSKQNASSHNM